ncbi:MAG: type II secretion system protein [Phycisphaerae bacterium]
MPRIRPGFTLVELLVVIGIIALLVSILLPVLGKAQNAARITTCLSNVKQVNAAVAGYLVENRQVFADAEYSNGGDSPLSPAYKGQPAYTPLPGYSTTGGPGGVTGRANVLPTIGAVLETYLSEGRDIWQCPSADIDDDEAYLELGDPLRGFTSSDFWRPNYFYMATKGYHEWGTLTGSNDGWRGGDWTVRNIAGLKPGQLASVTGQTSSQIVTLLDYKSYYHAPRGIDVYDLDPGDTDDYEANYAFADGHAETRTYNNLDEYLQALHEPVPQRQWGLDWQQAFPQYFQPYKQRYGL